jgi:urea transport system ATP-binding protein
MLELEGIGTRHGTTQVLFGVDLEVREREVVCLLGRNGAGKTTLLDTVLGVLPGRRGRVRFEGKDITGWPAHRRANAGIGYVPQGQVSFPQLTVRENLQVVTESSRRARPRAIDEVLDLFPVLTMMMGRPAGLLSGGQRQQLAMARALVTDPCLLILDEPTEGIQPSIVQAIATAIVALHRERDLTVLVAEQAVDFALAIADHFAVLDAGRLVRAGTTAEVDAEQLQTALTI